ncbi:putative PhoH family protein [Klebsiella phage CPRSA]|nr:putative PhoH family protein [Klebsiella phage CPRSA]
MKRDWQSDYCPKQSWNKNYEAITQTGVSLNLTNPAVPENVTLKIVDYVGPEEFPLDKQDARIIATCIQQGATLVTRDINMLLIAMSERLSGSSIHWR